MKVVLTKTVMDFSGSRFGPGTELVTYVGPDGELRVLGVQGLALGASQCEPVPDDRDYDELLERCGKEDHAG